MITKRQRCYSKVGTTVASELERRNGCRYGLRGVKVAVEGHQGAFIVWSTRWGAGRKLLIAVYPADGPQPVALHCVDPARHLCTHPLACYADPQYPPGMLFGVAPERLTLLGRWPVTCCKPRPEGGSTGSAQAPLGGRSRYGIR
jgi:hypothetical protein